MCRGMRDGDAMKFRCLQRQVSQLLQLQCCHYCQLPPQMFSAIHLLAADQAKRSSDIRFAEAKSRIAWVCLQPPLRVNFQCLTLACILIAMASNPIDDV